MITSLRILFSLFPFLAVSLAFGDGVSPWPNPPAIEVPLALVKPSLAADPADPAWKRAAVLPAFTRSAQDPEFAGPLPIPRTVVRLLWSPEALYVRFEAEDKDIQTPFTARDAAHYQGDVAEVFLDPAGAQRVWYEFAVTPRNGIADILHLCTAAVPHSGPDGVLDPNILAHETWDFPEWTCRDLKTAARLVPGGWIAEMAIPPQVLRSTPYAAFAPGPLRANFLRYDVTGMGDSQQRTLLCWSQVVFGRPHRSPARMGTLQLVGAKGQ